MEGGAWQGLGAGVVLACYLALIAALIAVGRRGDARAVAAFIPDCLVLFRGLLRDPRVSRGRKMLLLGLIGYLALPFDLVPDFVPVAGQLDDAIVVVLVLRWVLRAEGPQLVRDHWRGPEQTLGVILRLAYGRELASRLARPSQPLAGTRWLWVLAGRGRGRRPHRRGGCCASLRQLSARQTHRRPGSRQHPPRGRLARGRYPGKP